MTYLKKICAAAFCVYAMIAPAQHSTVRHGKFNGRLVLLALPDGRQMKLGEDFGYTDWEGHTLTAKAGFVSDGATIPRAVWSLVGGPWDGPYRNAAVVHDLGCSTHELTWQDTDKLFFEAMLDAGVERPLALTMYYGVLVGGPHWKVVATAAAKTSNDLNSQMQTELHKLGESDRATAIIQSSRTETSNGKNNAVAYKGAVIIPSNNAVNVSDSQLQVLRAELDKRAKSGELVSAEEIENLAQSQ